MTDSLPQVHQQEDAGLDTNTSGHDKRAQIAEGGKRLKVIYMSTNEKPVKRRRPNYSRDEVFALVTGVRKRWHILSSVSSTLTAADKQQAWEAVTKEVNGVSRVVRSVDEMRVKFFDFKSATKRKMMALNLKLTSIGDGSVTSPKFSEAEEAMAQLLDCEVAVPMGAKLKPQRPLPHPVSSGGGSAKLPKPKDFEVSRLQDSVVLEGLGYHLESEYYLRHQAAKKTAADSFVEVTTEGHSSATAEHKYSSSSLAKNAALVKSSPPVAEPSSPASPQPDPSPAPPHLILSQPVADHHATLHHGKSPLAPVKCASPQPSPSPSQELPFDAGHSRQNTDMVDSPATPRMTEIQQDLLTELRGMRDTMERMTSSLEILASTLLKYAAKESQ